MRGSARPLFVEPPVWATPDHPGCPEHTASYPHDCLECAVAELDGWAPWRVWTCDAPPRRPRAAPEPSPCHPEPAPTSSPCRPVLRLIRTETSDAR